MTTDDGRQERVFQALVGWVRSEGGSVDPRLTLGTTSNGIRGLSAAEAIDAGEVLLHVPTSLILDGGEDRPRVLRDELLKQEHSRWWPYFRLDESRTARLPATWSDADLAELQGLEPHDPRRHIEWYSQAWADGRPYKEFSDADEHALWIIVTRTCDAGLVPIYDLANHDNGQLNTRVETTGDGSFRMIARATVPPGHELFNSYGHTSSSDLFRDYGFIEPWPRVWTYAGPGGRVSKFTLLGAEGPVVLDAEQGAVDLSPERSTLAEKVAQAHAALAPIRGVQLLVIAHGMEFALGRLPTSIEEDERLVVTATGNRQRAIRYRIAYKQSLRAAMQFLRRAAEERTQGR